MFTLLPRCLVSCVLVLAIFYAPITPCFSQQDNKNKKVKEEPKAEKSKESKKEGKSLWDKTKSATTRVGKVAKDVATGKAKGDPVALALGALFNDQLPLKLDAGKTYKEVPAPAGFKPVAIKLTIQNIDTPLPPGDYTIPVRMVCTKDSVHVPGAGVGYKLAPMQGAQVNALSSLIIRGDLAQVPHETIQMIAWEIQASIPYSEMPKDHKAVIDRLIPEYKEDIKGGFFQRVEARYNNFLGKKSKIAPLSELLEAAGVGDTLRSMNRSRTIIREESFNYQRSQQRLYDPALGERIMPADPAQPSPWTQILPGVYSQIIIKDGWQGRNVMNFRITPQAQKQINAGINSQFSTFLPVKHSYSATVKGVSVARLFGFTVAAASTAEVAAFLATPAGMALAGLVLIAGVYYIIANDDLRPRFPSINPPFPVAESEPKITHSKAANTQALIPSPMIGGDGGGGGGKEYRKPKSNLSGKDGSKDIPSWAKGEKPYKGENGNQFAKRLLDAKYGKGKWKMPHSEHSQLKKFADRAFEP